mgnify:CR=1 FL=1
MDIEEKIAAKIKQLLILGEIDPSKIEDIEEKVGVKLNLSDEQLAMMTKVYENRQQYRRKIE